MRDRRIERDDSAPADGRVARPMQLDWYQSERRSGNLCQEGGQVLAHDELRREVWNVEIADALGNRACFHAAPLVTSASALGTRSLVMRPHSGGRTPRESEFELQMSHRPAVLAQYRWQPFCVREHWVSGQSLVGRLADHHAPIEADELHRSELRRSRARCPFVRNPNRHARADEALQFGSSTLHGVSDRGELDRLHYGWRRRWSLLLTAQYPDERLDVD